MAQTIKLKRSSTQGKVPTTSQLALGEIAINTYDGRIFFEKNDGSATIEHIVTTDSVTTGSIELTNSVTASGFFVSSNDGIISSGDDMHFKMNNTTVFKLAGDGTQDIFVGSGGWSGNLKIDTDAVVYSTSNSHLKIKDNVKLRIGNSNDIEIYHDGTNSYIQNGEGDLFINGDTDHIRIRAKDDEDSIVATPQGTVELYNDGSKILHTKASGIAVTGSIETTNRIDKQYLDDEVLNTSLNSLTGSLVTGTGSETLTNKTLTNPTINAARLLQGSGNILLDSNIYRDNGGSTDAHNYFGFNGDNVFRIGTDNKETIVATSGVAILKQGGNAKLQTNSSGVEVTGTLTATSLDISGDIDIDGTTNLDVVDIDGATNINDTTQSTSKTSGAIIIDGGVGIAKTLNVGEDVVAYASSDERYKDLITPIENPNEKIKLLSGNTFVWNDKHEVFKGKKDIGVIAQEVEKVLPEIVETRDNGYKAVKYEKIVALLIESNKELIKRVEELESKIK